MEIDVIDVDDPHTHPGVETSSPGSGSGGRLSKLARRVASRARDEVPPETTALARQTISRLTDRAGNGLPLWLALLFVGSAALGAWFLIGPSLGPGRYYHPGFSRSAYEYATPISLLFVPWGLALWAWHRGQRVSIWLLLAGALVLHILVLFAPLPQSQDFYQYLFYGKMQAVHGANPYLVHPSVFREDPWYVWIRWYSAPSVYGPAWTMVTFGVVKAVGGSLSASFVMLKLVILSLDIAVMAMIVAATRGRRDGDWGGRERDPKGASGWGILAYGWSPLVLISVPLAGANEVAIAASLLGAYLARRRGRTWLATILFTLAALIKPYAAIGLIAHLILLARDGRRKESARQLTLAVAISALFYAPYWAGWATFAGLFGAATTLSNLSPAGMLERLLTSLFDGIGLPAAAGVIHTLIRVAVVCLLVAAVTWAMRRVRDEETLWYGVLFVVAAYLFLTPWFFYWYAVAPLALVAAMPRNRLTDATLVFSGSSLIVFRFHPVLADWTVQTLTRYGLPIGIFLYQRPGRSTEERSLAPDVSELGPRLGARAGGGGLAPITVPTASALPVRAPAAD